MPQASAISIAAEEYAFAEPVSTARIRVESEHGSDEFPVAAIMTHSEAFQSYITAQHVELETNSNLPLSRAIANVPNSIYSKDNFDSFVAKKFPQSTADYIRRSGISAFHTFRDIIKQGEIISCYKQ